MQHKLQSFIEYHQLLKNSDQLAIAISGGKDSVCATHLINKLGYSFSLIHCNFKLRGEQSDADEIFVRKLASELSNCKGLHIESFDTIAYSDSKKISIQEAARELRYNYFDKLFEQGLFNKLITAHHKSDSLETFLINLYRSAGIKGLKGIPLTRSYLIRPLLAFNSTDIKNYIESKGIEYREDSSNSKNSYLRNKIRNQVLPAIKEFLPDFEKRAIKSIGELSEGGELFDFLLGKIRNEIVSKNGDDNNFKIQKSRLNIYPQADVFLYYLLDDFGFTRSQCRQICFGAKGGAQFYSNTHQALIHGDEFIISKSRMSTFSELKIADFGDYTFDNWTISLHDTNLPSKLNESQSEFVDPDNFEFPLTLRYWQEGDFIAPLGMSGKKLLSDFFIDLKIDRNERALTPLLAKENEIFWIIGHRISDKIKITSNSKSAVRLDFNKS